MNNLITIEGKEFSLVKVQRTDAAVYRSGNLYLRLGSRREIEQDFEFHKKMLEADFPVSRIVSSGEWKGLAYFIEESLGENHFGELFAQDIGVGGGIRDVTFHDFIEITKKFAIAQIGTSCIRNEADFEDGIHLSILCEELPEYKNSIRDRFSRAMKNLTSFPFVVTHGDFNPHNLFPEGVIDLESSFYGPAGYDLITNIIHNNWFPKFRHYEFFQLYKISEDQRSEYLEVVDRIYQSQGLPALSSHAVDFEFCRGVWSAVRMDKYPRLQKFRYKLLIEKFLA